MKCWGPHRDTRQSHGSGHYSCGSSPQGIGWRSEPEVCCEVNVSHLRQVRTLYSLRLGLLLLLLSVVVAVVVLAAAWPCVLLLFFFFLLLHASSSSSSKTEGQVLVIVLGERVSNLKKKKVTKTETCLAEDQVLPVQQTNKKNKNKKNKKRGGGGGGDCVCLFAKSATKIIVSAFKGQSLP